MQHFLDFVSYLLVASGHDLYSVTKRQYVKDDIEEIRKVEMSTKIQFLKHHGFSSLTKEYDSTFRNDIAHHNYAIADDGLLDVRGKTVDVGSKLHSMEGILAFAMETMDELRKKF